MIKHSAAGCVVFRNQGAFREYLLLHHRLGHWDFPKGHMDLGESPKDTCLRELQEETGVTPDEVTFIPGFQENVHYAYSHAGRHHDKTVTYFLVQCTVNQVKISNEHIGFQWLPVEQALQTMNYENARYLLRAADSLLAQRAQQKNLSEFVQP